MDHNTNDYAMTDAQKVPGPEMAQNAQNDQSAQNAQVAAYAAHFAAQQLAPRDFALLAAVPAMVPLVGTIAGNQPVIVTGGTVNIGSRRPQGPRGRWGPYKPAAEKNKGKKAAQDAKDKKAEEEEMAKEKKERLQKAKKLPAACFTDMELLDEVITAGNRAQEEAEQVYKAREAKLLELGRHREQLAALPSRQRPMDVDKLYHEHRAKEAK